MDLEQARKHRRNLLCMIAIFTVVGIIQEMVADNPFEGVWGGSIFTGMLFLGFFYGIHRYSRVMSSILFLMTISVLFKEDALGSEAIGAYIFYLMLLYFPFQGVRASFAYHRIQKAADPEYKSTRWWMWLLGVPVSLLLVLGIGFDLYQQHPNTPSGMVQDGEALRPEVIESLHTAGILEDDEKVLYFYSAHPLSYLKIGSVLTDQRIIAYKDKDDLSIHSSHYANILDVEIEQNEVISSATVLRLYLKTGSDFYVFLPNDEDSEKVFLNALRERIPTKDKVLTVVE